MKKSDIKQMPEYFDRYINLVDEVELEQAFAQSGWQLDNLDKSLLTRLNGKRYENEKWTVREIFQHLVDWERILSYRALLYARNKGAASQDIDGDLMAANINAERRTIDDLIDELKTIRASTKAMFGSFDAETLQNTGINWKYEISVLAMGFMIIGHQIHHLKIVEKKYYPLASGSRTTAS